MTDGGSRNMSIGRGTKGSRTGARWRLRKWRSRELGWRWTINSRRVSIHHLPSVAGSLGQLLSARLNIMWPSGVGMPPMHYECCPSTPFVGFCSLQNESPTGHDYLPSNDIATSFVQFQLHEQKVSSCFTLWYSDDAIDFYLPVSLLLYCLLMQTVALAGVRCTGLCTPWLTQMNGMKLRITRRQIVPLFTVRLIFFNFFFFEY